jgi:NADH:ubiquinone reductase (H+-translocating)
VIVGADCGELLAAKSLGHVPDLIAVTLISRTNHQLFQPLLRQMATRILHAGRLCERCVMFSGRRTPPSSWLR